MKNLRPDFQRPDRLDRLILILNWIVKFNNCLISYLFVSLLLPIFSFLLSTPSSKICRTNTSPSSFCLPNLPSSLCLHLLFSFPSILKDKQAKVSHGDVTCGLSSLLSGVIPTSAANDIPPRGRMGPTNSGTLA